MAKIKTWPEVISDQKIKRFVRRKPGLVIQHSDSEAGPWTPVPKVYRTILAQIIYQQCVGKLDILDMGQWPRGHR